MVELIEQEIHQREKHLRDYLKILQKRWKPGLTVFLVILVFGLLSHRPQVPMYVATTKILIQATPPIPTLTGRTWDPFWTNFYQTQYKILQSRSLAKKVIKKLHLDENPELIYPPKIKRNKIFEYTNFRYLIALIKNIPRRIYGTIRGAFSSQKKIKKNQSTLYSQNNKEKTEWEENRLVDMFLASLIVEPIKDTRLVNVGFRGYKPHLVAKIANAIAETFMEQDVEAQIETSRGAAGWLASRLEQQRIKLQESEEALLKYKQKIGIVSFGKEKTIVAEKLVKLNEKALQAELERIELQTKVQKLKSLNISEAKPELLMGILNDELVAELKSKLLEKRAALSELSKKYGPKHPKLKAARDEIRLLEHQLKKEVDEKIKTLEERYRLAAQREQAFKAALKEAQKKAQEINQKAIKLEFLQREVETNRQMFRLYLTRLKETSISDNEVRPSRVRIIDRAEPPAAPIPPRKTSTFMTLFLALAGGIGIVFFLEYLDNTVKTPEDIERYIGVPFLAPIEDVEQVKKDSKALEDALVTLKNPKSPYAEAFRGLRTNVLFSFPEKSPKAILINSPNPRDGKSFISANLAITMAQAGSKVVLIEGDLRKPTLGKYFGIKRNAPGLSNLLVGRSGKESFHTFSKEKNLVIIPAGPIPPNPSELLGSGAMKSLITTLSEKFERVIIDSPPLSAVADALILSIMVDGVIIVASAGKTHREAIREAVDKFKRVGAKIMGVILNKIPTGRKGKYYYKYQYYSYYYEEKEE